MFRPTTHDQAQERNRRTKCFKASQRRARGFILDADVSDPKLSCESGQPPQGRTRHVDDRPEGKPLATLTCRGYGQYLFQPVRVWRMYSVFVRCKHWREIDLTV